MGNGYWVTGLLASPLYLEPLRLPAYAADVSDCFSCLQPRIFPNAAKMDHLLRYSSRGGNSLCTCSIQPNICSMATGIWIGKIAAHVYGYGSCSVWNILKWYRHARIAINKVFYPHPHIDMLTTGGFHRFYGRTHRMGNHHNYCNMLSCFSIPFKTQTETIIETRVALYGTLSNGGSCLSVFSYGATKMGLYPVRLATIYR